MGIYTVRGGRPNQSARPDAYRRPMGRVLERADDDKANRSMMYVLRAPPRAEGNPRPVVWVSENPPAARYRPNNDSAIGKTGGDYIIGSITERQSARPSIENTVRQGG